ncbi:nuclear pore complex protein NUP88-like [Musa acuminata AAA Group]|uniref:nuclear pore complex protein NUP88-like n=1 Tax=Musa acuminata AAA Group TaxID=214697 RepID=UPI0031D50041
MTRIAAPDDDDGSGSPPPSTPPPPSAASKRDAFLLVTPGKHSVSSSAYEGGCRYASFPPTPPSVDSAKRSPLQWVPLDKHPFFSSTQSSGKSPRDSRRNSNLLAWDAASSLLYAWDPVARCVLRLSLRFRDADPHFSPSSSPSSAVLEAAIPPEVLMPDFQMESVVDQISLNVDGSLLLLVGSDSLRVMYLSKKTSPTDQRSCKTASVASQIFSGKNNGLQTLQASWHPYSRSHFGVLSSDSVFRLFDLSSDVERAEQEYYLQPAEPVRCKKAASFCPVAFSFGGQHLWDTFSIFIVFSDGSVYILCPVVPFGSICRRTHIEEIYEDINMFGLNSSDLKAVSNSRLAIDWLEATFPELADQSAEGGSTLVSTAHPYAPIDASLSLQGPLTKVYLREGNNKSEVESIAGGEGRVVDFLYRSIGKDSILVIAWSSGQLQIDALADEVQPQWNVGPSPRLHLDSYGHIKGVAMICDSSSEEIPISKFCPPGSNISMANRPNLGHPPPLLRLAIVDLALSKNVLESCPLSLFPDPLLDQTFYCLHGGGIDLIALQFLPFTNLIPDIDMIGKPPSVYPILNTCSSESSESCSSVLFGFVAIADLYGHSQILSLSTSYEFIVLEVKAWNELLHLHYDNDKRSAVDVEASLPEVISKDLLIGPKAIAIPSSTTLRSLTADSIEGRSTLHHYIKLFRENYVEYAHKVYVELKEHAGYLQTFLNDQNKRLREAKQSILNIEAKEADIRNRIDRSFKVYELLDQRLQNFRNLPATNKKPLSRAEHEFKAELDRFADVELDALHSAIQALNARLKRFYQSSSPASATPRSRKNVSNTQLSQIKSSLEMLSLLNKENSKKVKLIEHGLKSHEK